VTRLYFRAQAEQISMTRLVDHLIEEAHSSLAPIDDS
jgi:hypothetical protein